MPLLLILIGAGVVWFTLKNTGTTVFRAHTRIILSLDAPRRESAAVPPGAADTVVAAVIAEEVLRCLPAAEIVAGPVDKGNTPTGERWDIGFVMPHDITPADAYQAFLSSWARIIDVSSGLPN